MISQALSFLLLLPKAGWYLSSRTQNSVPQQLSSPREKNYFTQSSKEEESFKPLSFFSEKGAFNMV